VIWGYGDAMGIVGDNHPLLDTETQNYPNPGTRAFTMLIEIKHQGKYF